MSVGDGECEVDHDYVNPVNLPSKQRPIYSPFGGVEGELEVSNTGYKKPTPTPKASFGEEANSMEEEENVGMYVSSNRTTVTKKVTSSSTINRVQTETSKSASSKDGVHSVDRSSSSSSISQTSANFENDKVLGNVAGSGNDYDEESYGEDSYDDYEDYPEETYDRRPGSRTHSRISRKVYSTRTENQRQGGSSDTIIGGAVTDDSEGLDKTSSGLSSTTKISHTHSSLGNNDITIGELESSGDFGTSDGYWKSKPSEEDNSRRFDSSSSSSRRVETSRSYSGNDGARRNHDDTSRDNKLDEFSSRIGSVNSVNQGDWEKRTYDGGRGVEARRHSNRSYTGDDGSFNTEERHEFRSAHTSDSNPDQNFDRNRAGQRRTEQSSNIQSSRISTSSSADRNADHDDTLLLGRDGYGNRRTSYNNRDRFEDTHRTNSIDSSSGTADSNWETRTFDSGRGREDRRRTSNSYTEDDGTKVTQERNEMRRTHSTSDNFNPKWNDRSTNREMNSASSIAGSGSYASGSFDQDGSDTSNYYPREDLNRQSGHSSVTRSFDHRSGAPSVSDSRQSHSRISSRTSSSSIDHPDSRWNSGGFRSESSSHADGSSSRRRVNNNMHMGSGHGVGSRVDDRSGNFYNNNDHYDEYDTEADSTNNVNTGRGRTFTKTVIDDETGETKVYSRRVFGDYATDWKEVDPLEGKPTADGILSNTINTHNDGELRHSLHRVKRDKEMIVQPEAYTDDQTGRTLQVVNLVREDSDYYL